VTWEKLPPVVQAYILVLKNALPQSLDNIAQLEQKVNELEARLNRHAAAHHYRALLAMGS
jgi:cell division septum initiation protein DivIVA